MLFKLSVGIYAESMVTFESGLTFHVTEQALTVLELRER